MCGFVFNLSNHKINKQTLKKTIDSIKYRGPDETKIIEGKTNLNQSFYLGFNRLAIYDLDTRSMQPFQYMEDKWVLLFNGSIYNFKEIRKNLTNKGYHFKTQGDTEVVYLAFKEFGTSCFKFFNGMWSIVFFNKFSGELIISRDRLGVKPLYYQINKEEIFIASEPICFLEKSIENSEKNIIQIKKFIYCGMHDDNEDTFYNKIKQLEPNSLLKINFYTRQIKKEIYDNWDVDENQDNLEERISKSVNLRINSDVPNYSLLSGGLDSSLIAKFISKTQNNQNNFKGFITHKPNEENEYNETKYAKEISNSFNTKIEHHFIEYSNQTKLNDLINLTKIQQEPFLNPSILAHYETFQWVNSKKVRVLLTGEGADEIFGGYSKVYQPTYFYNALKKFDLKLLLEILYNKNVSFFKLFKKSSFLLPDNFNIQLLKNIRNKNNFLKDDLTKELKLSFKNWLTQQKMSLSNRLNFDITTTNLPHVLRNADRNSMNNSIELRHPYLDFNIIKYAMNMDIDKRAGVIGKRALRNISKKHNIPFSFKPKSLGFGQSYESNYFSKDLKQYIIDHAPLWSDICSKEKFIKSIRNLKKNDLTMWRSLSLILWLIFLGNKKIL